MSDKMYSTNPATEETFAEYAVHTPEQVEQSLAEAAGTFAAWRRTEFRERSEKMRRAAALLRSGKEKYGELITREMGKPIVEAEAEVEKCAWVCDFYAEGAERFLAPLQVETDAAESFVRFDPLGAVLAVMPWNFPFWQVFRFAAPALMAGNVGLLKHASNVPGSALAIEEIFHEAGFPPGAFITLLIGSGAVEGLIRDDRVAAVTLTGSEPAGRAVAAAAGRAIKKSVLELGGSDPFIVLADADIDRAAAGAALGRCINSGQSCIAAKRFIVEESVAEPFAAALVREMEALAVGDPLDRNTRIGPLARADLRVELHEQVERSLAAGAELRCGGMPAAGRGYYYPATVLDAVEPGTPAFEEEIFGPVAAIIHARTAREAIAFANRSSFGLGASIWTQDTQRGTEIAREIEAGAVFVNGIVKSDPRLPFGGVKRSGYGRELAEFGIREFVNVKSVWIG